MHSPNYASREAVHRLIDEGKMIRLPLNVRRWECTECRLIVKDSGQMARHIILKHRDRTAT